MWFQFSSETTGVHVTNITTQMAALSVWVGTPGIERGKDSATDYIFSQIKAKTEGSTAGKKELQFQLQLSCVFVNVTTLKNSHMMEK